MRLLELDVLILKSAESSAGWIQELENEHTPETEEFGIGSFVFRSKKPFHPERFLNFIQNDFPTNVIRSKGLFWLGSRSDQALIWSSAGGSIKSDPAGVCGHQCLFRKELIILLLSIIKHL